MTHDTADGPSTSGTDATETGDACTHWDNSGCTGTSHCPPRCPRFVDATGQPLLVRPLETTDIPSLVAMYEEFDSRDRMMGLPPRGTQMIRNWLESLFSDGWNLGIVDDDRIVGHIAVTPAEGAESELVIFVDNEYRGRGIGTELLKQAIAYAVDRDHDELHLDVMRNNRRAVSVYRNVDFEVIDEHSVQVAMALSLEKPIAERVRRPPAEREGPSGG